MEQKKALFDIHLISPLSVAPMVDWTYMHFRVFMRLIAPQALLYTEMQTVGAVVNNPSRALSFQPMEYPLALQLAGADKEELSHCAKIAEEKGFAEVNLNLGCPSDSVQAGRFGACLMAEPEQVVECIKRIKESIAIPVTAKTRIGIDDQDSYEFFSSFAHKLVDAGCDKLIVHARKAWLHGLNPKQNRTIPPVHYDFVYRLKTEIPSIPVVINGNIANLDEVGRHMQYVDGVMLGRLVYQNPYALMFIQQYFYPDTPIRSRHTILADYISYAQAQFKQGVSLSLLLKPIYNLAYGLPGARYWKHILSQAQQSQNIEQLAQAVDMLAELELEQEQEQQTLL